MKSTTGPPQVQIIIAREDALNEITDAMRCKAAKEDIGGGGPCLIVTV
jgi:hypothetical protein